MATNNSNDDVAMVIDGAELREVGGEGTTVLEKAPARLVVKGGAKPRLSVGATEVDLLAQKHTKVGEREYKFATDDIMTFLFLELPKGLPEVQYVAVAAILEALAAGKPVPTAAVAEGNSGVAVAGAPAAAAAPAPAGGIGAMFGALAAKALHDTRAVGEALRQKAEHDFKLVREGQEKAKAAPA